MARGNPGRLGRAASRAATALAVLLLAGIASPVRAEFPGEVWNVYDIDVASAGGGNVSSAVLMGLRRANQVYFYGDRPAKMRATVRPEGTIDIQLVDILTGGILLERDGLAFDVDGNVAEEVAGAALEWMEGLDCGANCVPGEAGGTAISQAPAAPALAPAVSSPPVIARSGPAAPSAVVAAQTAAAPAESTTPPQDQPSAAHANARPLLSLPAQTGVRRPSEAPIVAMAGPARRPSARSADAGTSASAPPAPAEPVGTPQVQASVGPRKSLAAQAGAGRPQPAPVVAMAEPTTGRAAPAPTAPRAQASAPGSATTRDTPPWVSAPAVDPAPTASAAPSLTARPPVTVSSLPAVQAGEAAPAVRAPLIAGAVEPSTAPSVPRVLASPRAAGSPPVEAADPEDMAPALALAVSEPQAGAAPQRLHRTAVAAQPSGAVQAADPAPAPLPAPGVPPAANDAPAALVAVTAEASPVADEADQPMQGIAPGVRLLAPRAGQSNPLAALPGAGNDAPLAGDAGADATLALAPIEPRLPVSSAPAFSAPRPAAPDPGEGPSAETPVDSAVVAQRTAVLKAAPASPPADVEPVPAASGTGTPLSAPAPAAAEPEVVRESSAAPERPARPMLANPATPLPAPQAPAPAPAPTDQAGVTSRQAAVAAEPASSGPSATAGESEPDQQLALAPATDPAPQRAQTEIADESQLVLPPDAMQAPAGNEASAEERVASIEPTAEGPTLANAQWVGFTPAVFTGSDTRPGAWISGPFDRKERIGWITDTATGATARVTFLWREGGRGTRNAVLSAEAARVLGLGQGDVANVAVYLPR